MGHRSCQTAAQKGGLGCDRSALFSMTSQVPEPSSECDQTTAIHSATTEQNMWRWVAPKERSHQQKLRMPTANHLTCIAANVMLVTAVQDMYLFIHRSFLQMYILTALAITIGIWSDEYAIFTCFCHCIL